ncbi:DUF4838 domain-containing protein [Terrimonas pollutisoli]|uniref:DUF4838 domain-containing protein n=1 Tax=Terrimonas pollutisoli TaxID=3034147 RepID=UPI0023EB31ED|nr:DUF4838 domain-containing protein [Terrimonas sp. H1YJ31]
MKTDFIKRIVLAKFLVFSFLLAYSQQKNDISKIVMLFHKELRKGGINADADNIQLQLLTQANLKNYNLSDAPSDAFYICVKNRIIEIKSGSNEGLRNGAYWYLGQLGYRYYFPGESWQFVPRLESAFKAMERTVVPSFSHRRIWYAYGTGSDKADADYNEWFQANLLGGEEVNTGHSYDGIVNRNKITFLQHPEYFAQKVSKGKIPPNPKFEVANDELVNLVIKDAFTQIEKRLQQTGKLPSMISMDPSDGGGFSTSPASLKIGGPSEQAFYLANKVASAVWEKYPSIKIGLYAYNLHAAPPKFSLEPNIVVLVATTLNQSAYRTDELMDLWKKKGAGVGIRDYYGVMAWDWDMPGQPKGSKLAYVNLLKDYHKRGIRFFSAETNIGWISRGPGHYIAAQLLWNIDADADKIQDEFFANMFGEAEDEMEELFKAWQKYTQPVPQDGDLYDWSKLLEKASKKDINAATQDRIDQVKQYLHYVYLFKKWKADSTDENLIGLLNYAYRVQDKGIVASYPLFRRIANAAVAGKANMRFNDPNAKWKKNNQPLGQEETRRNFYGDLNLLNRQEKTKLVALPGATQFKKRAQQRLSQVSSHNLKTSPQLKLRGIHRVVLQIHGDNAFINLSSGLIKAHQYKSLRLNIYPYQEDLSIAGTPLLSDTVQPSKPMKPISLESLQPGVYIAVIDDAKNGFTVSVSGNVSYAIVASVQSKAWTFSRNWLVFAVNYEKEFRIKNEGAMTLRSPAGRVIDLQKKKGIFTIQVQEGEKGIWKLERQSGTFYLEGLLPFVGIAPEFLVVLKD